MTKTKKRIKVPVIIRNDIEGEDIQEVEIDEPEVKQDHKVRVVVDYSSVNVRETPNGKILYVAKRGSTFTVLDRVNDWSKIESDETRRSGYIKSEFLKKVD